MKDVKGKFAVIVPTLIEPNGNVKRFLEVARSPKVQKMYEDLVKRLKCRPEDMGRKIREVTWGKKSVDEILSEVEGGSSR